jgi:hypothetical protein
MPVVATTLASLQDEASGLPAAIADYNAEDGHNYELEVPSEQAYYPGGDDTGAIVPWVEVAVGTGRIANFSLQQLSADLAADLSVALWLEGATGEIPEIYERALGYGRVLAEVLMVPDACGPLDVETMSFLFPAIPIGDFNPQTRTFDRWRTAAIVELTLEASAERP